jgi:hypothetical protein
MRCSKTVSIGLDDLNKIQKKIDENKYSTFSEFVQKAIKNELRG